MIKGCYFTNINIFNKKAHSLQIVKTVEALNATRGAEIFLAAPAYAKNKDTNVLFEYCGVKNKFKAVFLFSFFNFFRNKIDRISFISFNVPAIIYLIYLKFFKKIDFIYFRSEYFLPLAIASLVLKIPYYYEIHRRGLNKREEWAKTFLAGKAAGIVALTEELKDYYGKFSKNSGVAHDAVDIKRFDVKISKEEARKKISLDYQGNIFVYCGGIRKGKGIETVLKSAGNFPKDVFLFVGRVYPGFAETIKKYDNKNIKFSGEVPNDQVPFYLKAADLLVLPHPRSVRFQSPMKLFEYMASGQPIVSSDLKNIREILDSDEAIFFEPGDENDFSDKIRYFFKNKESLEKIGKRARLKADNFTWTKRGEEVLKVILTGPKYREKNQ